MIHRRERGERRGKIEEKGKNLLFCVSVWFFLCALFVLCGEMYLMR